MPDYLPFLIRRQEPYFFFQKNIHEKIKGIIFENYLSKC